MGKFYVVDTDGSFTAKPKKKAINIAFNKADQLNLIEIESRKNATMAQLEVTIQKVRNCLERRMTTDAAEAISPTFKSADYTATISLPVGELTDYQVRAILILLVDALDGESYNKIIPSVKPSKATKPSA